MPLRFVLDEHLRGGALWHAVQKHNAGGVDVLEVTRVGDPADLPIGISDSDLLQLAERAGRILVSLDKRTLTAHLADHLHGGGHSPGVLILRPGNTTAQVLSALVLIARAGDPVDYRDRINFIP
jgi:predicted nuclease of predicted toxin-antitoxin system